MVNLLTIRLLQVNFDSRRSFLMFFSCDFVESICRLGRIVARVLLLICGTFLVILFPGRFVATS